MKLFTSTPQLADSTTTSYTHSHQNSRMNTGLSFFNLRNVMKQSVNMLLLSFFLLIGVKGWGQTHFESGDGWGTAGWNAYTAMTQVPSSSGKYYIALQNTGTGNKYFRMANGAGTNRYGPSGTNDVQLSIGYSNNLEDWNSSNGKSYYINVANTSYKYVFKSNGATSKQVVVSEVQGAIQSVSTVGQSPLAASVTNVDNVTVTATLSGSLSTGQGVYLRYTTNAFSTSTVVAMTGSGTSYTGTIPAQATGTAVSYYVFTSGNGANNSPASDGSNADWYAFNLNNNSGTNYSYTTIKSTRYAVATGNWNATSTWSTTSGGSSGASVPGAGDDAYIEGG